MDTWGILRQMGKRQKVHRRRLGHDLPEQHVREWLWLNNKMVGADTHEQREKAKTKLENWTRAHPNTAHGIATILVGEGLVPDPRKTEVDGGGN